MRRTLRAFTLVELLVVIGIIALLLAILMPALSKARRMAQQTRAAAGLREMLMGYTMYHLDNNGALLLGYTPSSVNGAAITAADSITGATYSSLIAERYPWRLASYVGNLWEILHLHTEVPAVPQRGDPRSPPNPFTPDTADYKAYILSLLPAFGLNSIFLGGHNSALFAGFVGDQPNKGKHVAFRQSEIRRSSELIVFAEAQQAMIGMPVPSDGSGYFYVMPPRANGQRWTVTNGQFVITSGVITPLPKGRFGKRTLAGFFDGHVESLSPEDLTDMRRWAPKAESRDYDFVP